jgi:hypothetical protein
MISLPAIWEPRLVLAAHQTEPMTRSSADVRKTGRRPTAIAIGIAIKFPIPMNRVGYVIRSLALGLKS